MQEILQKIQDLEAKVSKTITTVKWNDKVSEAGIQLEGTATIERTGNIISAFGFPTGAGQLAVALLVRRNGDDAIVVVGLGDAKIV